MALATRPSEVHADLMKHAKNLLFAVVLIAGVALFSLFGRTSATDAEYAHAENPEIIAATFSSAWCSACKVLEPRLKAVIPDFADEPVKFVRLDFTLGQRGAVAEKAEAEGLAHIYPDYKGATGFTLLVDAETGEIVDSLTIKHSEAAMRAAIAQAVASARN